MSRRPLLISSLLLALAVSACGRQEAPRARNVLLIVVDTLRADRLSLYGYERATSPNLEAFAREGVTFENARSPAGCTFPSVNALLTSRVPAVFLGQPDMGIPGSVRALPEILGTHGYFSAAVSASPIVRNTPSRMNPIGGFGRGFQTFDEDCWRRHASCINEKAARLVRTLPEPWFLYLHYMEPHGPYRPATTHKRKFAPKQPAGVRPWARRGEVFPMSRRIYDKNLEYQFGPKDVAHLSDLYDEEISYFDEEFAKLVADLRETGALDRTAVAFVADHGEELYDHGHFAHCRDLGYETILKTPMVMRLPGAPQGVRRKALADNLDVVPTLLDYLGLAGEGEDFEGSTLRPVIEDDRPARRLSFGLQGVTRAVSDGTLKLRLDLATGRAQLFDIQIDPAEKTDLAARRPADARRLRAALDAWMGAHEGPVGESRRKAKELEQKLRSLGYL